MREREKGDRRVSLRVREGGEERERKSELTQVILLGRKMRVLLLFQRGEDGRGLRRVRDPRRRSTSERVARVERGE